MKIHEWSAPAKWAALLVLSLAITAGWRWANLPAALLLGPMIAGIVFGVSGTHLEVPRNAYIGAQAVIASMIAGSITPTIVGTFGADALFFVGAAAMTLVGATTLGWIMSRMGVMPGATAIYGMSPGAASAMVMLGEAHGADKSLVAFMQYTRVLMVAFATTFVAHFVAGTSVSPPGAPLWAQVHWGNLALVLACAVAGQQGARLLKMHAWGLIGPLIFVSTLHAAGWLTIELPVWLLAIAYATLGWYIGLGFHREALDHARRTLPAVLASALALIGFCALVSWPLAKIAHVDALTAYLATSPGGVDVAAIIAASTPSVNLPFVLGLQSIRLFATILLAPPLIRLVVRHSPHLTP